MPSECYTRQLDHLVMLASNPGSKDHAWHQAKELEADESGLWHGIANDLVRIMRSRASAGGLPASGG